MVLNDILNGLREKFEQTNHLVVFKILELTGACISSLPWLKLNTRVAFSNNSNYRLFFFSLFACFFGSVREQRLSSKWKNSGSSL